jgi:hypothetical protein
VHGHFAKQKNRRGHPPFFSPFGWYADGMDRVLISARTSDFECTIGEQIKAGEPNASPMAL